LLLDIGRPGGWIERDSREMKFLPNKGPKKPLGKEGGRRAATISGQCRVRDAME
jgi:hypothetical protein